MWHSLPSDGTAFQIDRVVTEHDRPVSVAQWANALSESQCLLGLTGSRLQWTGFRSMSGWFSVGWTNGRYTMRLISRTGTEGLPVSSLNCNRPLVSGMRVLEL